VAIIATLKYKFKHLRKLAHTAANNNNIIIQHYFLGGDQNSERTRKSNIKNILKNPHSCIDWRPLKIQDQTSICARKNYKINQ